jgi:hypothetical protein
MKKSFLPGETVSSLDPMRVETAKSPLGRNDRLPRQCSRSGVPDCSCACPWRASSSRHLLAASPGRRTAAVWRAPASVSALLLPSSSARASAPLAARSPPRPLTMGRISPRPVCRRSDDGLQLAAASHSDDG